MAFAQPIPRPFNERGIWFYAPAVSGVFGISNSKGWICIGESPDIRAALLDYLQARDLRFRDCAPTGFAFEPCAVEVRGHRHAQLTAEYHPSYRRPRTGAST